MGTLVVITGTGTEIGKTHVACAMLRAWERHRGPGARIGGLKPVESGVLPNTDGADAAALAGATMFHVKHSPPPYALREPVSPHLAARAEGRSIELPVISSWVAGARAATDGLVIELPGGLFSPLARDVTNAELVAALDPDHVVVVAPDRLGVLHDIAAVDRAARSTGVRLDGLILSTPSQPDASTGRNAAELSMVTSLRLWAAVPRAPVAEVASRPDLVDAVSRLRRA